MPKEVVLPELAESVVEGEILRWLVNEGETLKKDQPFVEVMTDKVTVELPSPYEGVLLRKLAKEGDVVPVHTPIALIAEPSEVEKTAPSLQAQEERSIVEPGAVEEDEGARLSLFKPDDRPEPIKNPFTLARGRVPAVPAARKLARELGLDIAQVPGSGPNGRVRVEDVRAYAETLRSKPPSTPAAPGFPPPVAYRTPKGYEERETRLPLRGMRRAIAQQMVASHLYTVRTLSVDEVDMTELVALRERLKPEAEAQGVRLSYLPFIFKALGVALRKFPALNSSLDEAKQEIVVKNYVNIGMAVATENGLVVPVIKDVERKSLLQLAKEANELAEKARSGKLAPEEVSGSTFSVTNIGSIGALFSFPIINVPDAAILGVHSIQKRPVVNEQDQVVVRQMMYLSLSFDHRLVDGAEAARFCKELIRLLEKPERLFLEAL
ncbi:2-oxo acid dehydrogenase subunit E2 [Meiothermus sp. QL-1]|uniref:dihydrolipoamide acetyltransferase family protein n=1 Tax=Meiothermus sp. QL-1 TaxID=2058095 RepID=UPI000E0A092B|nr:dihydrolipoamide acetyltransferase family protein [Meiothermus sp. QL-1]RDI96088.1 2-oxo acid dehydrogenase subunit E2 [Meiothermus sp. QL-1]